MSATVIDAFVVTLGLDITGMQRGQKQAQQQLQKTRTESTETAKAIEASGKQAAQFFVKMRNEALALFAVFTAGKALKNFIEDQVKTSVALGNTSQNLQMSTRDLVAWQRANERAGGTAEAMTAQLQEAQEAVAKRKLGISDDSMQEFYRRGGSVDDLKDANSYLMARARIIKSIFDVDPGRAQVVAKAMGISPETFNLFKQGDILAQRQMQRQREHITVTDKERQEVAKLNSAWLDFTEDAGDKGLKALAHFAPLIEKILKWLNQLIDYVILHEDDIVRWIDKTVDKAVELWDEFEKGTASVGGLNSALLILGGLELLKLSAALGGINGMLLTMSGLVGALAGTWLYDQIAGTPAGDKLSALEHGETTADQQRREMGLTKDTHAASDAIAGQLMQRGWSKARAYAAVGNWMQESSLDPTREGPGNHYGLGQWDATRQKDFKDLFGFDIRKSTLDQQVQFADYEIREGSRKKFGDMFFDPSNKEDTGNFARMMERYYESAANWGSPEEQVEFKKRSAFAEAAFDISDLAAMKTPGVPGATSNDNSTQADVNIGNVNIHTQATDGAGVAQSFGGAMTQIWRHATGQSETGPQ